METNPYAPPADDGDAPAAPPPGTRPSYALYAPGQVMLAGFLGSPVASAILMFLNYRRQGRARDATIALAAGAFATAALLAIGLVLPGNGGSVLPIVSLMALRQWASRDQPAFDAHVAAGGAKASWWRATGLGVAAMVGVLLTILPAAIGWDVLLGHHVEFGADQKVSYEGAASEADAKKLGAYLREAGFFDDSGQARDVSLKKSGVKYHVAFVLQEGAWDKPDIVEIFQTLRDRIAEHVFPASRVVVELCDDAFSVKKSITER